LKLLVKEFLMSKHPMKIAQTGLVSEIAENLVAPEIFTSVVSQFSLSDESVTIKLVSVRFDDSVAPPIKKAVVVGRIVLPVIGAQALVTQLNDFLEAHGVGSTVDGRAAVRQETMQ
jgi:hypothetical protein